MCQEATLQTTTHCIPSTADAAHPFSRGGWFVRLTGTSASENLGNENFVILGLCCRTRLQASYRRPSASGHFAGTSFGRLQSGVLGLNLPRDWGARRCI